jgi:hypothetical protein
MSRRMACLLKPNILVFPIGWARFGGREEKAGLIPEYWSEIARGVAEERAVRRCPFACIILTRWAQFPSNVGSIGSWIGAGSGCARRLIGPDRITVITSAASKRRRPTTARWLVGSSLKHRRYIAALIEARDERRAIQIERKEAANWWWPLNLMLNGPLHVKWTLRQSRALYSRVPGLANNPWCKA